MSGTSIRRAATADLTEIRQLIDDAYSKYIERIGRPPAPMNADYAAALEHSRVWVLGSAAVHKRSDDGEPVLLAPTWVPRNGPRTAGRLPARLLLKDSRQRPC